MIYLYVFFTFLIYPFQFLIPVFSKKAKIFLDRRKTDRKKISELRQDFTNKRVIWLHAASVGELDQCKALIGVIRKNEPETIVVQSVFSESVKDENLQSLDVFLAFRLPLDFYFAYDYIFKKFKPEMVILMAWDSWPNLILSAKRFHSKIFLFCASLNKSSGRSSFFMKSLTESVFRKLDAISASSEYFLPEFSALIKDNVKIYALGDTRVDSVIRKIETKDSKADPVKRLLPLTKKTIILASTYSACEEAIIPKIQDLLEKDINVWIFPHHIGEKRIREISDLLAANRISFSIFSEIEKKAERVVLFDKLGILAYAYEHAELAYVGGAIHNRVHNVLEPAYFGLAIVTGKKIFHSPEAISLKNSGGLFSIEEPKDIPLKILQLLNQEENLKAIRKKNRAFVLSQKGASLRLYEKFIKA